MFLQMKCEIKMGNSPVRRCYFPHDGVGHLQFIAFADDILCVMLDTEGEPKDL